MSKTKREITAIGVIVFIVLALISFISIALMIWGLITSLQSVNSYLYDNPLSFPSKLEFKNYSIVFNSFSMITLRNGRTYTVYIWEMIYNSAIYAGLGSLIAAAVPYVVSYITSQYRQFKICKIINATVIILMGLPIVGGMAPTVKLLSAMGIYNTHFSTLLLKAGFINTYYLIFYASWLGVSGTYKEAARIDGASEFTVMVRIMLPLMSKMFLTIFLILFVTNWNDYSNPMIYLYNHPVLATGVYSMAHTSRFVDLPDGSRVNLNRVPYRMAASMILLLPIMVIFITMNDKLMGNLSMGGLKE